MPPRRGDGEIVLRFDSGFWSNDTIDPRTPRRALHDGGANETGQSQAIAAIDEEAWVAIDYTVDGLAEVAETTYKGRRLVVRRTRLDGAKRLWPDWRHFGFLTDLDGTTVELDAFHREHAVSSSPSATSRKAPGSSTPLRSLLRQRRLAVCAVLAHNLVRWMAVLGADHDGLLVAKTVRRQLLDVPGRITSSARRLTLHLPARWPWAHSWLACFDRIRSLPQLT